MLGRCIARPPPCKRPWVHLAPQPAHVWRATGLQHSRIFHSSLLRLAQSHSDSQSDVSTSHSATADDRPRRPKRAPTSRKWHLFFVVGLIGFTVGSWYRLLGFYRPELNSSDPWDLRARYREVMQRRDSFLLLDVSKGTKSSSPKLDLSPTKFEPFEIVSVERVSSTASLFTLKHKDGARCIGLEAWKKGVWNVQFKQPQLQIVRAYTPLPPSSSILNEGSDWSPAEEDDERTNTLRFLIRRDERGGEMSSYLHRLPVGSAVDVRGPFVEHPLSQDVKSVVFIAGGTGIAPAMQVAHVMFDGLSERQRREKRLHILWANRRREDCQGVEGEKANSVAQTASSWMSWLSGSTTGNKVTETRQEEESTAIIRQLNGLKTQYGGDIRLSTFVDEEKSFIHTGTIEQALAAVKIEQPISDTAENAKAEKTQVVVSGPPGFITYLAGPKVWQDGEEKQGPLGGRLAQILGKAGRDDVKVWKV